jgi:undecaprenyl-diphosphatase
VNYELFQWINNMAYHNALLDAVMKTTSDKGLLMFAVWLVLLWLFGRDDMKRSVLAAGVTGLLALCVNIGIGMVYNEPRPFVTHHVNMLLPHAVDGGFPSDHTTGAFALAIALLLRNRAWGSWMLVLAVLTGISRVFVGHHYPGDVLASVVVATVVSLLVKRYENRLEFLYQLVSRLYDKIRIPVTGMFSKLAEREYRE